LKQSGGAQPQAMANKNKNSWLPEINVWNFGQQARTYPVNRHADYAAPLWPKPSTEPMAVLLCPAEVTTTSAMAIISCTSDTLMVILSCGQLACSCLSLLNL